MKIFKRQPYVQSQVRFYPNQWDMLATILVLTVIAGLTWGSKQMVSPYLLGQPIPIYLSPSHLPEYALRSVIRMVIALLFSLVFTFVFGSLAAKNKRAERLIIPAIDVLQSIPVLGFQAVAIVPFIALFPNSLLGPECAAIFAIFTSQAWNMILGFYQSLRTLPGELREATAMLRLSAWQRFWRLEVPFSVPSLLWNTMMSLSASWFFCGGLRSHYRNQSTHYPTRHWILYLCSNSAF